jgi:hypothetical protein
MTKKKPSVISIVLWAVSLLLLIYSVWSIVTAHSIIGEAIAAGQITLKDSLYEIVNYYMQSTAVYVLFAILFAVIGWKSVKTVEIEPTVFALAADDASTDEAEPDSEDTDSADGNKENTEESVAPEDIEFEELPEETDESGKAEDLPKE